MAKSLFLINFCNISRWLGNGHTTGRFFHRFLIPTLLSANDIATLSGAWQGALYGISSNQPFNALRRPHNRCPHVKGLYFAGGTTHPGGGVPMVTLSGKVASGLLREDYG